MIRPATTGDLPRLYEIMVDVYHRTPYAKAGIEMSPTLTRSLLMEGVRRNGGLHVGGTSLNVIEKDGKVEAFMLGQLQPIYGIGVGLQAIDRLLCATKKAPKISSSILVKAYIEWAEDNERVKDIYLSFTNIAGVDGSKLSALYKRVGFQRIGEIWKRGV